MNEQKPYEKHLAGKLNQLTQPGDANKHWPQMKALLDRDLPESGGRNKRPGAWWMYGIIAGILLTGAWFGTSLFSKDKNDQSLSTEVATSSNQSKQTTTSPSGSLATDEGNNTIIGSTGSKQSNKEASAPANPNSTASIPLPGEEKNNSEKNSITVGKDKGVSETFSDSSPAAKEEKNKGNAATTISTNTKEVATAGLSLVAVRDISAYEKKNKSLNTNKKDYSPGESSRKPQNKPQTEGKESGVNPAQQVVYIAGSSSNNNKINKVKPSPAASNLSIASPEELATATIVNQEISNPGSGKIGPAGIFPDSLERDYAAEVAAVPYVAQAKSRFKTETERVKSMKNRSVGTGDNKNFAYGLSLPLGVPLGDQEVVAYNIRGGANTALDYFPMPHMQYHINQKSYLQAELQFMNPQYIQPALIFQHKYEIPGNPNNIRYVSNSVYASKLYYFSLPIGIHYSPFKNFYMGSGMQFSSLISGIAMTENRGYYTSGSTFRDSLLSQSYSKFKNDSISGSLNGNEFRLMLDANYYWQRFMVGLRYNQALSNYVSIKASNTAPLFTDKNKSIQFYLRYNLWEDKKRKKTVLVAGR